MLYALLSIIGGLVAASSFVIARKPGAQHIFDRLAPYQGFLGVGMLVVGGLWLVDVLPHIGSWFSVSPLRAAMVVGALVGTVLVGFLLGYGLVAKLLQKNEAAREKGQDLMVKLAKVQVPLGLLTAGLCVACIVL